VGNNDGQAHLEIVAKRKFIGSRESKPGPAHSLVTKLSYSGYNIKLYLEEIVFDFVNWNHMTQDRVKLLVLVNNVTSLRDFLSSSASIS
jgi:hypothetical protein